MAGIIFTVLGIVSLVIVFFLIKFLIRGAIILLEMAADQAFVGLAVYIACWVFMLPVMAVVCIVFGVIDWWSER